MPVPKGLSPLPLPFEGKGSLDCGMGYHGVALNGDSFATFVA